MLSFLEVKVLSSASFPTQITQNIPYSSYYSKKCGLWEVKQGDGSAVAEVCLVPQRRKSALDPVRLRSIPLDYVVFFQIFHECVFFIFRSGTDEAQALGSSDDLHYENAPAIFSKPAVVSLPGNTGIKPQKISQTPRPPTHKRKAGQPSIPMSIRSMLPLISSGEI